VVEWRQILIASIYFLSEDGFTLFGITTKQATALKPCQIFYRQRWLACCPTLLRSPDLDLREEGWGGVIIIVIISYGMQQCWCYGATISVIWLDYNLVVGL